MKKILSVIILTILSFSVFSQIAPRNAKYWTKDKLSWSDFKDTPVKNSYYPYYINVGIDFDYTKILRNDTIYYLNDFKIYYHPDFSWCIPEYREDSTLNKFQLLFDFAEYKKREIQQIGNRQRIHPIIVRKMSFELDSILKIVYESKNYDTLNHYIDHFRSLIDKTEIEYFPNYEFKNSGFGLDFGMNGSILHGNVSNYLTNNLGVHCNFYYYYKKNFLSFGLLFGFSKLIQEIPNTNYYPRDKIHANVISEQLLYGREFSIKGKIFLYPMAGISLKGIVSSVENQEESLSIWENPTPCIGLKVNLPLRKKVAFSDKKSMYFKKDFVQNDFAFRLLFETMSLSKDIKGTMITIGIGYSIKARPLKFMD